VTADVLAPICSLAAGLLVVAGAAKLVRPRATAQALLDAGLPGSLGLARGLGAVEIGVGAWALLAPGMGGAVALGIAYVTFAGFLAYVLRTRPDAGSCGCAGPTPVPPSRLHLVLDLVAGLGALAYVATSPQSAPAWIAGFGWVGVPIVLGLVLAGWLTVVAVTQVPGAFRAWEAPAHDHADEPYGHDHAVADAELELSGIEPGHPSLWPGVKEPPA
jgi:hypothetical protein